MTEITGDGLAAIEVPRPTDEELQNEYNYIFAEELTGKLRNKGLITDEQYAAIMRKNRESFSPLISKIMPK